MLVGAFAHSPTPRLELSLTPDPLVGAFAHTPTPSLELSLTPDPLVGTFAHHCQSVCLSVCLSSLSSQTVDRQTVRFS